MRKLVAELSVLRWDCQKPPAVKYVKLLTVSGMFMATLGNFFSIIFPLLKMPDAYHVISIPVKSLACLALAPELHRCAAVNVFTCPGEGTISETALWRAPRVFVLQTAFWKCQPQELKCSKSHGSHVWYSLYVSHLAILFEFAARTFWPSGAPLQCFQVHMYCVKFFICSFAIPQLYFKSYSMNSSNPSCSQLFLKVPRAATAGVFWFERTAHCVWLCEEALQSPISLSPKSCGRGRSTKKW